MDREFIKFINQKPEQKQEQISDLKNLERDKTITAETFKERLAKAIEEINKRQNEVLNKFKSWLEGLLGSSNERLLGIFKQGGFKERIELIEEQIIELREETKRKIESLSGQEQYEREREIKSLIGQEQYERESYEQLVKRIADALEGLEGQKEQMEKIGLLPKVGILADSKYIENQQIDIIKAKDNEFKIYFKLTEEHYKKILSKYTGNHESRIVYVNKERSVNKEIYSHFTLADALRKDVDGAIIRISKGTKIDTKINSALGLVEITIKQNDNTKLTPEQITQKINEILTKELEIEDGLYLPTKEAEYEYKVARYKWHHKTEEVPVDIDQRLKREEVAPGYFTFVDEGKHKEYQKVSRYAIYHQIVYIENLPKIIQAGGLLSLHERYRRGLTVSGLLSPGDFISGGADSVFTRIITENGLKTSGKENEPMRYSVLIVFDNSLLDRTDCYAYDRDRWGSTDPNEFRNRLNPTELLNRLNQSICYGNEQMFRSGISTDKFKAIVCYDENYALEISDLLHKSGITEINGRSVDDMIIIAKKMIDLVDISEGKLENVKTVRSLLKDKHP